MLWQEAARSVSIRTSPRRCQRPPPAPPATSSVLPASSTSLCLRRRCYAAARTLGYSAAQMMLGPPTIACSCFASISPLTAHPSLFSLVVCLAKAIRSNISFTPYPLSFHCSLQRGYATEGHFGAATPPKIWTESWVQLRSPDPPPAGAFGRGPPPAAVSMHSATA